MLKPKNAPGIFDGITKLAAPNLAALPKHNLARMFDAVGEPPDAEPEKKRAGEATGVGENLVHVETSKRRLVYDLSTARRATAVLKRLPSQDESFHCIMGGDYHGFDLVIAVRELAAEPIDALHVATLGFNRHNISHLCAMLDAGDVRTARIICSEYFSGADPETFNFARSSLARRGQTIVAARNHAKLLLFAIGSRRFALESSANLRSCNNLEQFALYQSPTLYAFHRDWIERVVSYAAA